MLKRSSRERNAEDTEEAKTKNYLGKKKKIQSRITSELNFNSVSEQCACRSTATRLVF